MPFITEEIYHYLPGAGKSISLEPFPRAEELPLDEEAESIIRLLQEVVTEIRTIRSEHRLPPSLKIPAWIKASDGLTRSRLIELRSSVEFLSGLSQLEIKDSFESGVACLRGAGSSWEVAIPAQGLVDLEAERKRLQKEIEDVEEEIAKLKNRLLNPAFLEKAPKEVVEETKTNLARLEERRHRLLKSLAGMD
jgi:valyl-tRNA synthetase